MSTMPTAEEMATIERLAERLHRAKAFPDTVRSVDTAFAILLKGWELGMPAMAAAAGISIVSGKVSLGADATAGACLRHRDICLYFSLVESTNEIARYETRRAGAPAPVVLAYTIAQARTAGLTGSSTWQKHPPAMLRARCAAALARAVYPDLVAGCYDPDEAREINGEYARGDASPVATTPAEPPAASVAPSPGYVAQISDDEIARLGIEHRGDVAPVESDAQLPPALEAFFARIAEVELPGEAVTVWMKHRADLATLPAPDREEAWKELCRRTEVVGKMKNAKVWLKKAIAEEDGRRASVEPKVEAQS